MNRSDIMQMSHDELIDLIYSIRAENQSLRQEVEERRRKNRTSTLPIYDLPSVSKDSLLKGIMAHYKNPMVSITIHDIYDGGNDGEAEKDN